MKRDAGVTPASWLTIPQSFLLLADEVITNRCQMVAIKHWLRHPGVATLGLARRVYHRLRTGRTPAESR